MKIYYLFSSITFLQFFIPLCIEFNKRKHKNIFIVRKNLKEYANPLNQDHLKIIKKYSKKYNISLLFIKNYEISKINGIVFMVDGDIYGPPREIILKDSLLKKLNPKQTLKITMTEHLNFMANYHNYINLVDYAIFTNHHIIKQMKNIGSNGNIIKFSNDFSIDISKLNYENKKNIFLGNTKFDNIPKKEILLKKYKLNPNKKYCLILYPKTNGGARENFTIGEMEKIYGFLRKLGYNIIVKIRPKDGGVPNTLSGDKLINSDIYPNETLELLKLCNFCIMSSSSACDETIYMKVPCIDLESDLRNYHRNSYLLDDRVYLRLPNNTWRNINFESFKKKHDIMDKKDSKYFEKIKEKYLFNWNSSSYKIANFILKKYRNRFLEKK